MTVTSPRLDPRLAAAAFVFDERRLPYAETWRRVGELAVQLDLPRPGYDTVRRLLRANRHRRDEIRGILAPVAGSIVRGYISPVDLMRVQEAAAVAAQSRRAGR